MEFLLHFALTMGYVNAASLLLLAITLACSIGLPFADGWIEYQNRTQN